MLEGGFNEIIQVKVLLSDVSLPRESEVTGLEISQVNESRTLLLLNCNKILSPNQVTFLDTEGWHMDLSLGGH